MSRPWYLHQSNPGDGRTGHRLVPVRTLAGILPGYCGTAVEDLLAYHNLGRPLRSHAQAEMLIAMCMDHRKMLRIPENFAFILRTGGGNLRRIEFKLSYAIAIGGVRTVCLIAHNHCGMVELSRRRSDFVRGLVENGGWDRREAEAHFDASAPEFEIGDPVSFVGQETQRLSRRYPKVLFAPLHYDVEDGTLSQVVVSLSSHASEEDFPRDELVGESKDEHGSAVMPNGAKPPSSPPTPGEAAHDEP